MPVLFGRVRPLGPAGVSSTGVISGGHFNVGVGDEVEVKGGSLFGIFTPSPTSRLGLEGIVNST